MHLTFEVVLVIFDENKVLMEILNPLVFFILAICVVVGFHEFGHYIAARLSGVRVDTFSIGMGPKVFAWKSAKSGVVYQLSALPIGGYVKMWESSWLKDKLGRELSKEESDLCFDNATILRRFFIVANGPFFNFVLAVLGYMVISYSASVIPRPIVGNIIPNTVAQASDLKTGDEFYSVNGKRISDWESVALSLSISAGGMNKIPAEIIRNKTKVNIFISGVGAAVTRDTHVFDAFGFYPIQSSGTNKVTEVIEASAAFDIRVKQGDVVESINGCETPNLRSIISCLNSIDINTLTIKVTRGDQVLNLSGKWLTGQGLGINTESITSSKHYKAVDGEGFVDSAYRGYQKAIDVTVFTTESIFKLITGKLSHEMIGGPITLAKAADNSASHGYIQFINFLCIFSISLMILNLLPIPPLDGGHLLINIFEVTIGQSAAAKINTVLNAVGIVLIALLMIFAITNDVIYEVF